jgi:hypothetical protein
MSLCRYEVDSGLRPLASWAARIDLWGPDAHYGDICVKYAIVVTSVLILIPSTAHKAALCNLLWPLEGG